MTIQQYIVAKNDSKTLFDKLHSFIWQKCSLTLTYPLTTVLKESLETGKVADAFFQANITPLFKKGSYVEHVN